MSTPQNKGLCTFLKEGLDTKIGGRGGIAVRPFFVPPPGLKSSILASRFAVLMFCICFVDLLFCGLAIVLFGSFDVLLSFDFF